jgi:hypothetical protein
MRDRRGAYRVLWEDLRERDHLEDLSVDGGEIKTWILKIDWILLAQDWDRWWALVNAVMNLLVP